MLTDGATYSLPDGTLVIYRVPLVGAARLDDQGGRPVYIRDGRDGWRAMRWSSELQGYEAAPCDLVDDDMELVF
jgi:hypothetical protein